MPTEETWPDVSCLRKYVEFKAESDAVTLGATLGKESPGITAGVAAAGAGPGATTKGRRRSIRRLLF